MAIQREQNYIYTGDVDLQGGLKLSSGTPGAGKVLTSDGSGNATWQSSSSGVILSNTTTLSSSDILSLHSIPITLVPAQGAGTLISVLAAFFWLDYNSVAYATDTSLRIQYKTTPTTIVTNSGILAQTNDYLARLYTGNISTSGAIAIINDDVEVTTPTSNPTLGDSPVKITVLYSVITL